MWLVTCPADSAGRAGHLHRGHAAGRRADAGLARLESGQPPRRPHRLLDASLRQNIWPPKSRPGFRIGVGSVHLVIHGGDVLGGHADLDHLEVLGRLEHAVPNLRRLDDAIARAQDERRPLILVHQPTQPW